MRKSFEFKTFISNDKTTFLEYKTIEHCISDQGEEILKVYSSYFPEGSNTTYEELKNIQEDCPWSVAIIDIHGSMKLHQVKNTWELKDHLDNFILMAKTPDHVTLYKQKKLINI